MIAVIIPCYRVRQQVLGLIARIGAEVAAIYVVDDCCPEECGRFVRERCPDPRVVFFFIAENQGVGGAMVTRLPARHWQMGRGAGQD